MKRKWRRVINPFVILLAIFFALAASYVTWSLRLDSLLAILVAFLFFLIWLTPILFFGPKESDRGGKAVILQFAGFIAMGVVSFLFVFTLIKDVLWLVGQGLGLSHVDHLIYQHGPFAVLALTLLSVATGIARVYKGPVVKQVEIYLQHLPIEFVGFKMGQISDLHVGVTLKRGFVQKIIDVLNSRRVDLVALTGDFVDGSVTELGAHVTLLSKLEPRQQVYFVSGNHEFYSDGPAWIEFFRGLGFHVLENEFVVLTRGTSHLVIAGVTDPAARMVDKAAGPDPDAVAAKIAEDQRLGTVPKILLVHNPKIAKRAAASGFDLQLSGHTHGGQFFPWNFFAWLVHRPHFLGLSREARMQVYVNAGTGAWGPPLRFGTRPEITILTLQKG